MPVREINIECFYNTAKVDSKRSSEKSDVFNVLTAVSLNFVSAEGLLQVWLGRCLSET